MDRDDRVETFGVKEGEVGDVVAMDFNVDFGRLRARSRDCYLAFVGVYRHHSGAQVRKGDRVDPRTTTEVEHALVGDVAKELSPEPFYVPRPQFDRRFTI